MATIVREDGYRLWGNRTLSADARYQFLSIGRTVDLILDSLQRAHLWAVEIDMGLEKLEASWSMDSVDEELLRRWGLAADSLTPCVFRGALQSEDASVRAVAAHCLGMLREVDYGDWKPGEKSTLKCTMAVRRYRLEIDGAVIHDIDVPNMVRVVDGTDQLAAQRAALGI